MSWRVPTSIERDEMNSRIKARAREIAGPDPEAERLRGLIRTYVGQRVGTWCPHCCVHGAEHHQDDCALAALVAEAEKKP